MNNLTRREFVYLMGTGATALGTTAVLGDMLPSHRTRDEILNDALARIQQYRKGLLKLRVCDASGHPLPRARVAVQMQQHAFGFGSAVTARYLREDSSTGEIYRKTVREHFNRAVFENDLKVLPWRASQTNRHPSFRREWTLDALQWLREHDVAVRGHHLVCARLRPEQYRRLQGLSKSRLKQGIMEHLKDILTALGPYVKEWDAINHLGVLDRSLETYMNDPRIYSEIIQTARDMAPDTEMWVNEGTILASRRRRRHYENMIRTLCRTDAAPDGIGLMGHFNAPRYPSVQQLHQVLDRYAALVPRLQITELDIRTGGDEYAQAEYLRTLMTAAFSHPAVESIMCWGFWAGRHPRPDAALFYRRNWTLKPAGAVWRELVFNEWWTDEVLHTDAEGYVSTHGFLGDYRIDVMHEGRTQQRNLILVPQGLSETIVMG